MKVDVVILDESSMVGHELFGFLKEELYQNNRISSFLFIGDSAQLMPIDTENAFETYKHPIYNNPNINHYQLTKLIRNGDPEVIDFVTVIRKMIENKKTKYDMFNFLTEEAKHNDKYNKIHFYDNKKEFMTEFLKTDRIGNTDACIATFTNANVQKYNKSFRDYYMKKKYNECPEIHIDDLFVVQSGNDEYMNSEILKLETFVPEEFNFKGKRFKGYNCTTVNGKEFKYLSEESRNEYEYALELLKATAIKKKTGNDWKIYYYLLGFFLEVKYHYAYTTHKLQGSSYKDIFVDMTGLGYVEDSTLLRLFYVAITRAKNEVYILI